MDAWASKWAITPRAKRWSLTRPWSFPPFSGSLADNWGYTATYDAQGNLYGGGIVFDAGYPTTAGAIDPTYNDVTSGGLRRDGYWLTKFSANGSPLVLHLHRRDSPDQPHSMMVNNAGELVILGTTGSDDFPIPTGLDFPIPGGTCLWPCSRITELI